jgi:energy-coupling factor transporter ATP-binding protein EcfA2
MVDERDFELRYLKSRGTAFQDLFSEIMERTFPGDFQRIRPHGRAGDLKCDGYLKSQRCVFQVYGPEDIRPLDRMLRKIRADYAGALHHWAGRIDEWIFVHNQRGGLPAQVVQLLDDLRQQANAPTIKTWGYEELRRLLHANGREPAVPHTQEHHPPFPETVAAQRYWAWVAESIQRVAPPRHLAELQALDLPIRLISPDTAKVLRVAEEREIAEALRATEIISSKDDRELGKPPEPAINDLSHALRRHRQLLVIGEPGSGKSTLLRRFAVREAKRLQTSGVARKHRRTPVLVDLWRFASERSVVDLITGSVARSGLGTTSEEILLAADCGYVVLLFDGLDELGDNDRRACLAQILTLAERFPRTELVLTSRPFPDPPTHFHRFAIAPLRDEDLVRVIRTRFKSSDKRETPLEHLTPAEYVRFMRPEIRLLCRIPLTLGLVLQILTKDGVLPRTLYEIYDRDLSWRLNWEVRKGSLPSAIAASTIIEEVAYDLVVRNQINLGSTDWAKIAGRVMLDLRTRGIVALGPSVEEILNALLSAGLLQDHGDQLGFDHRTFVEFLAARHILGVSVPAHANPVARQLGVARFLCVGLQDPTQLLEECLRQYNDVQSLLPLLSEGSRARSLDARFEALYWAIIDGQEVADHLTYWMRGPDEEAFTGRISALVETCLDFKPKALSVLKDVADGIVRAVPWSRSRQWFEMVVAGMERYGWPGANLYRRFAEIGVFEAIDKFVDDGFDPDAAEGTDALFGFLGTMLVDDFASANERLSRLEEFLK